MTPVDAAASAETLPPGLEEPGEGGTIRQDRWEEKPTGCSGSACRSRRSRAASSSTARPLGAGCSRRSGQPYRRPSATETLLAQHADFLRRRVPQVRYSARILFQELGKQHG